jgi:hypothetical protein
MAGSPLKRQRRKELRCIQPRIPMHQWRSFSDTEKIVAIFGMSIDEVLELMSIPFAEADLQERNLKLRVFECMMKAGLQLTRDRERAPTHATRSSSTSAPLCVNAGRIPIAEGEPKSATNVITAASTSPPYNCSAASH